MPTHAVDLEAAGAQLTAWFQRLWPETHGIALTPLKRPGGGVSSETYLFEVSGRQGSEPFLRKLVIRWPPTGFTAFPRHAYAVAPQYRLLQCLAGTSVPVPAVLGLEEDESVIGRPFFVMAQVEGWVPGDFPPYHVEGPLFEASQADRLRTWWDAMDTMGKIHTLDWQAAGLEFLGVPAPGKGFMERQIAVYDEVFALNGEPMPAVLSHTRDWLLRNSFAPRHVSLCWGDARLGNMIMRDHRVAAVLDWEMACIGDPESDLGWFAHIDWATSVGRSKSPFPRMAGLPGMAETMAHYERATGRRVENLHYHEVFATWRLAILFSRIEQDATYLARSGNAKGFITWTHFDKLKNLLGI
jgi:aminoglycoside phosphotransferase (APT) family kinase protein